MRLPPLRLASRYGFLVRRQVDVWRDLEIFLEAHKYVWMKSKVMTFVESTDPLPMTRQGIPPSNTPEETVPVAPNSNDEPCALKMPFSQPREWKPLTRYSQAVLAFFPFASSQKSGTSLALTQT